MKDLFEQSAELRSKLDAFENYMKSLRDQVDLNVKAEINQALIHITPLRDRLWRIDKALELMEKT